MTFQEILNMDKPVLVSLYSKDCGPCAILSKIIEDLKNELNEEIHFELIDVDLNKITSIQLGVNFQVKGTPSLLFFIDGKLIWKHFGVLFKEDLLKRISPYIED